MPDKMIELKDITVKFGEKSLFNGFNFAFEDGKNYAIVGPSGCGKSTLLRVICGLLKPTNGVVTFKDEQLKGPNPNIFMMHQTYSNFPWLKAIDNVLFPLKLRGSITKDHIEEAKSILEKVGLGDSMDKFPSEMSGGMKQRLSLARTLMFKPHIILMDEPTSALDEKTRLKMEDLLLELDRKDHNLIIMVTHNESQAKSMCDTTIQL